MRRPLVIDLNRDLPARPHTLLPAEFAQVFGGCLSFGQPCRSASECCQDRVPAGSYVLCYFYRGHGDFVAGYCTYSAAVYGD